MKEKRKDIIDAGKETMETITTEDIIPIFIEKALSGTVLEAATGLLGAAAPRIGMFVLSYQNKRAIRNVERLLNELSEKNDEINKKIKNLEKSKKQDLIYHYFPIITDYALKSKQEDKIKYMVNGYKNFPDQGDFTEDFVLLYYDVLDTLNLLDLRILNLCVKGGVNDDNIQHVMRDNHLQQNRKSLSYPL